MAVVLKKGNGILYFIIAVLVLALVTCVVFLMKREQPAVGGAGTNFSGKEQSVLGEQVTADVKESVLGVDANAEPGKDEKTESVLNASEGTVNVPEAQKPQEDKKQVSSIVQKMVEGVAAYYSAPTPEKKLEYVLHPEIVGPLMKSYYAKNPYRTKKVARMNVPVGMALDGVAYWKAQGTFDDGSPFFVALRMVDGKPRVDWESEVPYSDFDWDEWVDDPSSKPGEFRVYAKSDAVYVPPFTDSSRYRCIQLKTMNSSRTIFGYVDMNDFDQKEFYNTLTEASGGPLECLLKLEKSKPDKGEKGETRIPSAKILQVISPSWINTRVPHDE